uniref:40S ribosomal protein S8 n=1 Tax=Coccolithus braarudii TaxID=221442 RepID=A0A7S0Q6B4_9EUKA|mmetsp:Transcript_3930/g.8522  ORF Transcript_3930/g.8522 Transcript_3930/m.8522 type:complete len:207 (+) Transcript_3930:60-680(+)
MGISRDSQHKRRLTGGKKPTHHKKRKHEMGRQMAMTKIGSKRIRSIRVRGGNTKFRALRLDTGNFSWGSEVCTRKTRVLDVVYNASNNELVRTKTLVKSAIVQIDATPFRQWYESHYGVLVGKKRKKEDVDKAEADKKEQSKYVQKKLAARQEVRTLDTNINSQFDTGRLLACISSRPGQCGRCDGYILEGKELEFYVKRMARKKK